MKPKVLLAGGTGYIGRYLSRVIEHDAQLYALSKYPKPCLLYTSPSPRD